MNMETELAIKFHKLLMDEIDENIELSQSYGQLIFKYAGIKIVLLEHVDNLTGVDFIEKDILDALCRMRLLIIERCNRELPNNNRHPAYKDLEIEGINISDSSIYITDNKKLITISFK
jgi:hypothetical protein